jgi:hypothetical protein
MAGQAMITLHSDIGAADRLIVVDGIVGDEVQPGYLFRLDDELLEFGGFETSDRTDRNAWYVERGREGTTGASHDADTEVLGVTAAFAAATSGSAPPSPFASGGGGGGVSLLGPVTLTFDDLAAASGSPLPTGFDIPVGAIVLKAWAVISVNGDTDAGSAIWLAIADAANISAAKIISRYDASDGYIPPTAFAYTEMGPLNSSDPSQVLANGPRSAVARLACTITVTASGGMTDGSIAVYAIIASPAS